MTGLLASVTSLPEALLAVDGGADIIDLKQPAAGALGALEVAVIAEIVRHCRGLRPVSATIGDLAMQPQRVFDAVQTIAQTGVDYVKIGFFPEGDTPATLTRLAELTGQGYALIAVLFADRQPDLAGIAAIEQAGFAGVMLDTMDKRCGSLTEVMPWPALARFVERAKAHGLLCGLAGSLRLADIAGLLALQPDYLGFRGALCAGHERVAQLDASAIAQIRRAIVRR